MKIMYFVDEKKKTTRWVNLDGFTDIYTAIDYAVAESKKHPSPYKIRVYDFENERNVLYIEK